MANTEELLSKLGMKKAESALKTKKKLHLKLTLAYEHFRYVTPENFGEYNEKLKQKSLKVTGHKGLNLTEHFDKVVFSKLSDYEEIPPVEVLEKAEEALKLGCFDSLEVAQVKGVRVYKDPILFGCINGCGDKFVIAQWDDDLRIEDLIGETEG